MYILKLKKKKEKRITGLSKARYNAIITLYAKIEIIKFDLIFIDNSIPG